MFSWKLNSGKGFLAWKDCKRATTFRPSPDFLVHAGATTNLDNYLHDSVDMCDDCHGLKFGCCKKVCPTTVEYSRRKREIVCENCHVVIARHQLACLPMDADWLGDVGCCCSVKDRELVSNTDSDSTDGELEDDSLGPDVGMGWYNSQVAWSGTQSDGSIAEDWAKWPVALLQTRVGSGYVFDMGKVKKSISCEDVWAMDYGWKVHYAGDVPGRQCLLFGETDYAYSGANLRAHQKPTWLVGLENRMIKEIGENGLKLDSSNFASCLINVYPTHSSIPFHCDNEREIDQMKPIISLSWGGSTQFTIKRKIGNSAKPGMMHSFELKDGTVAVLKPGMQQDWLHRTMEQRELRVSFTWRSVSDAKDDAGKSRVLPPTGRRSPRPPVATSSGETQEAKTEGNHPGGLFGGRGKSAFVQIPEMGSSAKGQCGEKDSPVDGGIEETDELPPMDGEDETGTGRPKSWDDGSLGHDGGCEDEEDGSPSLAGDDVQFDDGREGRLGGRGSDRGDRVEDNVTEPLFVQNMHRMPDGKTVVTNESSERSRSREASQDTGTTLGMVAGGARTRYNTAVDFTNVHPRDVAAGLPLLPEGFEQNLRVFLKDKVAGKQRVPSFIPTLYHESKLWLEKFDLGSSGMQDSAVCLDVRSKIIAEVMSDVTEERLINKKMFEESNVLQNINKFLKKGDSYGMLVPPWVLILLVAFVSCSSLFFGGEVCLLIKPDVDEYRTDGIGFGYGVAAFTEKITLGYVPSYKIMVNAAEAHHTTLGWKVLAFVEKYTDYTFESVGTALYSVPVSVREGFLLVGGVQNSTEAADNIINALKEVHVKLPIVVFVRWWLGSTHVVEKGFCSSSNFNYKILPLIFCLTAIMCVVFLISLRRFIIGVRNLGCPN